MITFQLTTALVLSILAFLAAGYCLWQTISLSQLRKKFFAGTQAIDLESVIVNLQQELADSRQHQSILERTLLETRETLGFAVQKVGLVRFNPFNDGGGNFSFALALLDAQGNGVVLTSMYGREQNRIYTKKIDDGKCDAKLTDEEQEAVIIATQNHQTNSKNKR